MGASRHLQQPRTDRLQPPENIAGINGPTFTLGVLVHLAQILMLGRLLRWADIA